MSRCGLFSGHKLRLTASARIKCDKCKMMWELDGMQVVPLGYKSWKAWFDDCDRRGGLPGRAPEGLTTRDNPLPPRDIAMTVADDIIKSRHITDQAQIDALHRQASTDPGGFIHAVRFG